jgi:hypothetical protein
VEDREPEEARQLDYTWVGEELGKVTAYGLRRGSRRRAEVY